MPEKCNGCGLEHPPVNDAWLRVAADDRHGKDGEIEIDEHAPVSRGDPCGAYVQAWVWVPFPALREAKTR